MLTFRPCNLTRTPNIQPRTTRILRLRHECHAGALHWLDLPGSMTAAIGEFLGSPPAVEPIREGPGRSARWESALLATADRAFYIREVVLRAGSADVLLARTLTLRNDPAVRTLRQLRRQPLAEVLFQNDRWQRAYPPLALEMRDGNHAVPGRVSLWRNRSARHSRLLVEEFFLAPLLMRA